MLTEGILHTCVLAVDTSGILHHKSKIPLKLHLDTSLGIMDCGCIEFLSVELRVSYIVRLQQNLYLSWNIQLHHFSSWIKQAVLLLKPPICLMCLLLLFIAQILRQSPLCIRHMVIIPSFFGDIHHWVDFLFHRSDSWVLLAIPKQYRQVLLNEFHSYFLNYHFGAKKVCFLLSGHIWWPNILLSCKQALFCSAILQKSKSSAQPQPVFFSHYLFQKASLYPRVLISIYTCFFVMGIMLFSPVLTN